MKKKLFLALAALVSMVSMAKADVEINATNFPDEKFRNWLTTETDYGSDGVITTAEMSNVRSLNMTYRGIKDLTGIAYFTSLQTLLVTNNLLTSLDVSQCVALTWLYCSGNQLTEIVLPNNQILQELNCSSNQLTGTLDVSRYVELTLLNCSGNQLTGITLPQSSKLKTLTCNNNNLTELDVSANTNLEKLYCSSCALASLDVSQNTALTYLDCRYNRLTALDLSHNTALPATVSCNQIRYQLHDGNDNSLEGVLYNGKLAIKVAPGFDVSRVQGEMKLQYYFVEAGRIEDAGTISDFTLVGDLLVLDYSSADFLAHCQQEGCVGRIRYEYNVGHSDNIMTVDLPVYEWKAREYDLWVNGTQVTSDNCEDIENLTNWDQGCMSYDEMTNTLTLDNVYIGATIDIGINDSIPGLTIQLIGESTLNMSDNDGLRTYFDATITGQGKLTLKSGKTNGITIYNGTLTVKDGAEVVADASAATAQASLTIQKGCGISGRMYVRTLGSTTRTTYYGSLVVEGNGTKVSAIGSLMSMGPLKALTYPSAGTLTVLNAANNEVNGYFYDHAVCLRSGDGSLTSPYTYTPTTFLVTLTCPTDGFAIDEAHFPDAQFRAYLLSQSYGTDAWLTNDEIASITTLSMNNQGIADLTGVGYFTALKELWVNGNALTAIDLTGLPLLVNVEVMNNQLSTEALTALIASLPTYEEMAMRVLCLYGEYSGTEGNAVPTAEQRLAVWQKGWFPKYRLASGGFENYPMPGDTDKDMTLTDADIHILAEMLARKRTTNDESDFDCDGTTSLSDLTKLVNWLKR